MKKLIGLLLAALVIYTMYYDLHTGTLPDSPKAQASSAQQKENVMPSKKVKVKPGATVLSISEHLNQNATVPIQKVIDDFEKLNPNVKANRITIGETYQFPVYEDSQE